MLALPGGPTRVEWRRNRRARRVSLRIDPCGGGVVVTLPMRAGRGAGVALLMNHADWVANRLAALPDALPFADGTLVPIGDVPHRIRHVPQSRGGAWLQDGELHVTGAPEFLRRRVRTFFAPKRFGAFRARCREDRDPRRDGAAHCGEGYAQPLGQLRRRRLARVQLAPGDDAGICAGLRRRARSGASEAHEPRQAVLGSSSIN